MSETTGTKSNGPNGLARLRLNQSQEWRQKWPAVADAANEYLDVIG